MDDRLANQRSTVGGKQRTISQQRQDDQIQSDEMQNFDSDTNNRFHGSTSPVPEYSDYASFPVSLSNLTTESARTLKEFKVPAVFPGSSASPVVRSLFVGRPLPAVDKNAPVL